MLIDDLQLPKQKAWQKGVSPNPDTPRHPKVRLRGHSKLIRERTLRVLSRIEVLGTTQQVRSIPKEDGVLDAQQVVFVTYSKDAEICADPTSESGLVRTLARHTRNGTVQRTREGSSS